MKHIKIYESWLEDQDDYDEPYDDQDYYDSDQFSRGLEKKPYNTYLGKDSFRKKPSIVLPYTQKSPKEASDLVIQKIKSGGSKVPMYFRSYSDMSGSNLRKMLTRKSKENGFRSVILLGSEHNDPGFMNKVKDNDIIMIYSNDISREKIDNKIQKILDLAKTSGNKVFILYSTKYEPNRTFIREAGEENNILVR